MTITPMITPAEERIQALILRFVWAANPGVQIHGTAQAAYELAAEINAYRARIAELEGLLREAMPMLKGAADLKTAVDELARDLPI